MALASRVGNVARRFGPRLSDVIVLSVLASMANCSSIDPAVSVDAGFRNWCKLQPNCSDADNPNNRH